MPVLIKTNLHNQLRDVRDLLCLSIDDYEIDNIVSKINLLEKREYNMFVDALGFTIKNIKENKNKILQAEVNIEEFKKRREPIENEGITARDRRFKEIDALIASETEAIKRDDNYIVDDEKELTKMFDDFLNYNLIVSPILNKKYKLSPEEKNEITRLIAVFCKNFYAYKTSAFYDKIPTGGNQRENHFYKFVKLALKAPVNRHKNPRTLVEEYDGDLGLLFLNAMRYRAEGDASALKEIIEITNDPNALSLNIFDADEIEELVNNGKL